MITERKHCSVTLEQGFGGVEKDGAESGDRGEGGGGSGCRVYGREIRAEVINPQSAQAIAEGISLSDTPLALVRMIPLDLADRQLAGLPHLPARVPQIAPQQRHAPRTTQCAERFGRLVSDHRAMPTVVVDEDGLESGDGAGIGQLPQDVGELVLQQRRGVNQACGIVRTVLEGLGRN